MSSLLVGTLVVIPVLSVAGFLRWTSRTAQDVETKARTWEVFLKGVSVFLLTVGGLVSVLKYLDSKDNENEVRRMQLEHDRNDLAQRTREFNVHLYESPQDKNDYRYRIFHETVDVVATLATSKGLDEPAAKIALDRFERLYWGQMAMVEDIEGSEVEDKMIEFRKALIEWQSTGKRDSDTRSPKSLQRICLHLAYACRSRLEKQADAAASRQPGKQ